MIYNKRKTSKVEAIWLFLLVKIHRFNITVNHYRRNFRAQGMQIKCYFFFLQYFVLGVNKFLNKDEWKLRRKRTHPHGWDLAEWLERRAKVATVLGSIPAYSDTVKSEIRQMKNNVQKRRKSKKSSFKKKLKRSSHVREEMWEGWCGTWARGPTIFHKPTGTAGSYSGGILTI